MLLLENGGNSLIGVALVEVSFCRGGIIMISSKQQGAGLCGPLIWMAPRSQTYFMEVSFLDSTFVMLHRSQTTEAGYILGR